MYAENLADSCHILAHEVMSGNRLKYEAGESGHDVVLCCMYVCILRARVQRTLDPYAEAIL